LQKQDVLAAFNGSHDLGEPARMVNIRETAKSVRSSFGQRLTPPITTAGRKQRRARPQCARGDQAVLRTKELSRQTIQTNFISNELGAVSEPLRRCESGSTCENDKVASYRDLDGEATCNETTGNVDVTVFKEHCAGDCILQHEQTHATDFSGSCQAFSNCINNAPDIDGRNNCRAKWKAFQDANDAWTQCNAYNIEGQCLTTLINNNCNVSGGPVSEDCCASLQNELNTVGQRATYYCSQATAFLPFGLV
jgi:hypothetical protein